MATTVAPDPTRKQIEDNREQAVHAIFGYLFITDKYEGVILVGAGTLLDGNPLNNFLKRDLTYNPDGLLTGAKALSFVGTLGYLCCDAGLVIIDFNEPTKPVIKKVIKDPVLKKPHQVAAQFRYAYVCDETGLVVLDITDPLEPRRVGKLAMKEARSIYLARTYAYVAAGKEGLVIVDIEHPDKPRVDQVFNANGVMDDVNDVKLGITYTSQFAYVADGKHGLRVVQLTSPHTPGNSGFSPRPTPELIATYKLPEGGKALAISRGVDRDRAVDESGNQLSVFGRVGARPFNAQEQRKLYLREGKLWTVDDDPATMRRVVKPSKR